LKKNIDVECKKKKENWIFSLSFVKATAWVILGISGMFSTDNLVSVQSNEYWVFTISQFGLAVAFLLAGLFFNANKQKNIYLLLIVILLDVFVSIQNHIGIFDSLMILFDIIFYWLIFHYLKITKS
jgi:hypothetical protein